MPDTVSERRATLVQLRVEDIRTSAELTSTSSSGLAVLLLEDAAGQLRPALARTMDTLHRVHLADAADVPATEVDVSLVWFDVCGEGAAGPRIEVIVDGSDSPGWEAFLAATGIP